MVTDVLAFALTAVFGGWLLRVVIAGVRTGRIRHTDSTSTFSFRTQPARFTFVAAVLTSFAAVFVYLATLKAIATWARVAA